MMYWNDAHCVTVGHGIVPIIGIELRVVVRNVVKWMTNEETEVAE
jgi:hypothetical protein